MKLSRPFRSACSLLLFGFCVAAAGVRAAAPIPDVALLDQQGRAVHFQRDLVQGHVVAVNFIFTSCSTICPQLGAASAELARALAGRGDGRYRVVSISIDPEIDTPERLRTWSENFGTAPGWTLLTGPRRDVETLLKALQAYTPDKDLHTSTFLLGNEATGEWKRVNGSASTGTLVDALQTLAGDPAKAPLPAMAATGPATAAPVAVAEAPRTTISAAAAGYFPDVPLIDQHGATLRFYSDLLKGRVVVIDTIFADCGGPCPLMTERFAKVQAQLGDRVGRDVTLISISVDPVNDTPEKLLGYAERVGAKPGWHFLTGDKANIDLVLRRLGQYVDTREAHSNLFIIGNEPTGLWKKAFGLAPAEDVIRIVQSVLDDRG